MYDNREPVIHGWATKYNAPFRSGGSRWVQFRPKCFAESLAWNNQYALVDHDDARVIGSRRTDTLRFGDSRHWLRFLITFGDDNHRLLAEAMQGVQNGRTRKASIAWFEEDGYTDRDGVRCILRAHLEEVSVCDRGNCKDAFASIGLMNYRSPWSSFPKFHLAPKSDVLPRSPYKYQTPFPRYAIALGG